MTVGKSLDERLKGNVALAVQHRVFGDLYNGHEHYQSLNDVPFLTEKHITSADLASAANERQAAVFHFFTSGTTGRRKKIPYTVHDIASVSQYLRWFCVVERIKPRSRVLVLMDQYYWGIGQLTAYGHMAAGNIVIPVDTDLSKSSIQGIVECTQPNVISSLPSVIDKFLDVLKCHSIEVVETTGERLEQAQREKFESALGARVLDAYGLSEGLVGVECPLQDGYHFDEEAVFIELIAIDGVGPVGEQETGELVISVFNHSLMPITRYRTGDVCHVSSTPCQCGISGRRVWLHGRVGDHINLFEGYSIHKESLIALLTKELDLEDVQLKFERRERRELSIFVRPYSTLVERAVSRIVENIALEVIEMIRQGELVIRVKGM